MFMALLAVVAFIFSLGYAIRRRRTKVGQSASQPTGHAFCALSLVPPIQPRSSHRFATKHAVIYERLPHQEWSEDRAKDAAEGASRFAGFDLFVGNIPFSVSEKVSLLVGLVGILVGWSMGLVGQSMGLVVRSVGWLFGWSMGCSVRRSFGLVIKREKGVVVGMATRRYALTLRRLAVAGPPFPPARAVFLSFGRSMGWAVGRSIVGPVGRAADRQTGTSCRDDHALVSRLASHGRRSPFPSAKVIFSSVGRWIGQSIGRTGDIHGRRQTDRQIDRQIDRQTDRLADRQADTLTNMLTNRQDRQGALVGSQLVFASHVWRPCTHIFP